MKDFTKILSVLTALTIPLIPFATDNAEQMFHQPPQIRIPAMPSMTIDGIITGDEQKYTAGMIGFCRHGSSRKMMLLTPAEAKFNIGTDGKNLYIGAVCETGPQGILERSRAGRCGMSILLDDSFEFVFVPNPEDKMPSIYHMITNNKGGFMTSARKNSSNMAWEPVFVSKGKVIDGKWQYEISIPLDNFGIKEFTAGQKFGIRVCRNWKRVTSDFGSQHGAQSSWSQDKCAFFSTDALPIMIYDPSAPLVSFLSVTKNGKADLKASVFNPTGKSLSLKITTAHKPDNSQSLLQSENISIKDGETEIIVLPKAQFMENETVSTAFSVTSSDKKQTYYHRAFRWDLAKRQFFRNDNDKQQKIALKYAYYPESDNMFINLDFSAQKEIKIKSLSAAVLSKDNRKITDTAIPFPKNGVCEFLWKLPDLKNTTQKINPSGEYLLKITVNNDEKSSLERKFERKIFPWEGNNLGKSNRILPRFTPIKISNDTVSVVMRDYRMNKLGLFNQIKADGDKLLAGDGMIFEAVVNGKKQKVAGKELKFIQTSNTKAVAKASWNAGAMNAAAICTWDYDGLMKYALTLYPFTGQLDSLKLIIPLNERNAYLFHACTDGLRFNYGGAVPAGNGRIWDSTKATRRDLQTDYVNYIWLGTESSGLAICGENDKGYVHAPGIPVQELVRQDGKIYLICNLVAKPIKIAAPRTMKFAFQATPVKPMAKNWRLSALWGTPDDALPYLDYHMVFIGSSRPYGGETLSDDLAPRDNDISLWKLFGNIRRLKGFPESYTDKNGKEHHFGSKDFANKFLDYWCRGYANKKLVPGYRSELNYSLYTLCKGAPGQVTFYTNARGMRTDTPEAYTFRDNWFREEFQGARDREPERPSSLSYSLDPGKSFRDYATYWYNQMFISGACDNLYWDDVFMASNLDRSGAGSAYILPDGRLQPSTGLWNMRKLIHRAAVLQLELGKTPNNTVHMTNTAIAPICAFAQQNLDWEDNLGTNPFQQRYTREYIRATSIGRQFGNLPGGLGLVASGGNPKVINWCLRTGAGVSLTHEVLWTKGKAAVDYWKNRIEMMKFGYGKDNVQVWNYWDRDYPVKISGETSSILLSSPDKKECILLVCDYGNGGSFNVTLDTGKLKLQGKLSAYNWETGKAITVKGSTLNFSMKKYDFINIRIKCGK